MSIRLENVSHVYGRKTPNEHLALKNINLEIKEGEFGKIGSRTTFKRVIAAYGRNSLCRRHGFVL